MYKQILLIATISGGLAVALGAFGAHALKAILESNQRADTYELASRYQFYHSLALLALGLLAMHTSSRYFLYAAYSFLAGILIFSGSLYILALTNKTWLGAITPLGGVALILGWLFFMLAIFDHSN